MAIAFTFVIPTIVMLFYLTIAIFYPDAVALVEREFTLGGLTFGLSLSLIAYGANQIQQDLGFVAQILSALSFLMGLSSAVCAGGYLWIRALVLCAAWAVSWWSLSLLPFGGAVL